MKFLIISDSESNKLDQAHIKIRNLEINVYVLQNHIIELKAQNEELLKTVKLVNERNITEKQRTRNHTASFLKLRNTVNENDEKFMKFVQKIEESTSTTRFLIRDHMSRLDELDSSIEILTNQFNNLNI